MESQQWYFKRDRGVYGTGNLFGTWYIQVCFFRTWYT